MIIQGDSIEMMKTLPPDCVDLVVCDLPYGVTANKKDVVIPFEKLWEQYNRVVKDNGTIVLFAQGLFLVDLINSNRKDFRYDLVWDKELTSGFLDANRKPLRKHEHILIFQKKPKQCVYNPQFTVGKPLHSKGHSYKNKELKNQNYGDFEATDDSRAGSTQKYPTSIIKFQKPHPSKALHRTEKPVELLKWLIKTYSNEQQVVMDNTCGSGGVGVACLELKRNYILIDNDPDCIEITKNRLMNNEPER